MPPKGSGQFSTIEFLSTLNKYIPSLVLTQLITRQEKNQGPNSQLPELQPMTTVCLFADISGFTNVSEACAKKGVRGNEELAFCINRYMEGMVKHLGKYGGDIIKFVGDAMIVMWPPEQVVGQSPDDSATLTVRKAIQCALDIQKDMNNFKVIAGVSSLSVKIGIGYGNCALLYVGGVFGRAEFFTVGPALTFALKSEENATAGGQIIVSDSAFKYVRRFYQGDEIINDHGEKFYKIIKLVGEGVKTRADALVLRSNISAETYNKIATQLRGCVPAAIIPYLQIGSEEFGSETRSLTVMFASLGVELSSAETKEGMEKIQKIVVTVQQQVYRQEGSVNKLVMDDKGSTLICLWGLTPMGHDDDAARAILTAFNMRKELKKIEGVWCNIGISSGELFSGVVGTSGGRKEFSVLGDIANLAARVMYWPKKFGEKGKIHVDLNTRALASNQFSFVYRGHQEFKGKSISIPIFEPVDPLEEQINITKKLIAPEVFLKPHMNPMCLERSTETNKKTWLKLVGPGQIAVEDIALEIIQYFEQINVHKPYLASVKGEIGSGKTLFARCLIDQLTLSDEFNDMMNGKNSIFCTSLNSESQFQFLNIWRPVLQQMMTWYCKKENLLREQVAERILRTGDGFESNQDKREILCELLGVNPQLINVKSSAKQVKPCFRMFPFVMREVYEEKKQIIELVTNFVKIVIGEQDDVSFDGNSQSQHKAKEEMYPVLVIMDSVNFMDGPSWLLYESIREECSRIGLILLQLCDDRGEVQIHPEALKEFDQVWHAKSMEDLHLIELPVLDQTTFLSLLKTSAGKYQQTYMDEINKMIEIVKPAETIKTEEMGKQWKEILSKKWQVENKLIDVNSDSTSIIKVIIQRCAGNPLLSLYFFVSLLQNSFINIDTNGLLVTTVRFQHLQKLNDYVTVPVPRFAIKHNVSMIDKFLKSITNKPSKRPGELEACVKAIVMLKAATVLGDEFDLKSLKAVNPLRVSESIESLKQLLKLLESHDFIEILDETDKDNLICRFNKPFLREALYQIVLFRDQKKGMHGAAAQYFLQNQNSMNLIGGTQVRDPESQAEVLKHHMIVSQDVDNEGELSYQSRTGLYVSRIQNIINRDEKAMIKREYIYKQGKGANKKTSKRLVTINSQYFRWYHDEDELKNHTYLGSVPIQFIFQTVASKMVRGDKAAFSLSTSSWFNKNQQEEGMRDFFFACDTDLQMEDWIITIEFLRTKAVYDAYAQKNIPVQFPLKTNQDKKQQEESKDWNSLLYDFGGQLKQQTHMAVKNNSSFQNSTVQNTSKVRMSIMQSGLNQSLIKDQQLSVTELVKSTKALYGMGILSFSHHLIQTSTKMTVKQQAAHIGQIPDAVQSKVRENLGGLLNDQSLYYSNHTNSQENLKSQKMTDESKEETQKLRVARRGINERRGSSISADNVAKQAEENQKYYNKNDLIHEETEDQTSDELLADSQKVKKEARKSDIVQHDLQKLQPKLSNKERSHKSDLAMIHKGSDDSPMTTPLLSLQSASPNDESEVNRQTFKPSKSYAQKTIEHEETMQLFNQDDRVDNLRSQSPSQKQHQRVQSMQVTSDNRNNPSQQQIKDENFLSQSTVKQANLEDQQQSMMQSLQQLISQSIEKGMTQLIQHNQSIVNAQKDELNQMMLQQQQIINQSMLNRSGISYQETPRKSNILESFTPHRYSQTGLSPNIGGITSVKSRRKMDESENKPVSKSIRQFLSDEDDEPADPEISDDPDEKERLRIVKNQSYKFSSSLKHSLTRQQSMVDQRQKSDESKQTIKREEYTQPRVSNYQHQKTQGFQGKFAQKPVDSALLNFQEEKLFFPPPERWIANEYAFYEEPVISKKSTLMDFDKQNKKEANEDEAVCIKDSACQLKGSALKVKEGVHVKILEHFAHINMYKILFKGQQGLFPVKDFTRVIKRKIAADYNADRVLDQMSPIHPVESQNFFKEVPERELTYQMSKMTLGQIARTSNRILEEDKVELKQQNLKMLERQQKKLKKQRKNI